MVIYMLPILPNGGRLETHSYVLAISPSTSSQPQLCNVQPSQSADSIGITPDNCRSACEHTLTLISGAASSVLGHSDVLIRSPTSPARVRVSALEIGWRQD